MAMWCTCIAMDTAAQTRAYLLQHDGPGHIPQTHAPILPGGDDAGDPQS